MNKIKAYIFIFCIQTILFISLLNSQWIRCTEIDSIGTGILTSITINNKLYLGTTNGIYCSTDEGNSWNEYSSGLSNRYIRAIVAFDSINICVGTNGGGIFLSTNGGIDWKESNNGLSDTYIMSLFYSNGILLASCLSSSQSTAMYISWDKGASWKKIPNIPDTYLRSFNFSKGKYYAGVYPFYVSIDSGKTWSPETMGGWTTIVDDIFVDDSIMIVASPSGVFYSSDYGTKWNYSTDGLLYQVSPPYNMTLYRIAKVHSAYLIGTWNFGVRRSDDIGKTWYGFNEGIPNGASIYSFAQSKYYLFGNLGTAIYRIPLSDFITNVTKDARVSPKTFNLSHNFPNPFNPSTTISFNLPSQAFVSLKVFNALGGEIATLVTGEFSTGTHSAMWNANNMPSGVYFCRLLANNDVKTIKMTLLK